jgi:hypothetical protein
MISDIVMVELKKRIILINMLKFDKFPYIIIHPNLKFRCDTLIHGNYSMIAINL